MKTAFTATGSSLVAMVIATMGAPWPVVAQAPLRNSPSAVAESQLAGIWAGESNCAVRNTGCRDDKVIYHITVREGNQVKFAAVKLMAGKWVKADPRDYKYDGAGEYRYDGKSGILVSETEGGVWSFTVKGDTMEGVLTLPDKTIYRRASLMKQADRPRD